MIRETLLASREGRLLRLTLNRPERRNALNMAMCRNLIDVIGDANRDNSIGAILLDSNGSDFCSGMDLMEVLEADPQELIALHRELFTVRGRIRKPMVAMVQGSVLAGGVGLMLNAHVVVADPSARFGLTERRIGFWPYAIFNALAAAVGERKATELSLTARIIEVDEALRIGLVDVVPAVGKLGEEAFGIAQGLADASTEAIEDGLRFVEQTMGMTSEAAGESVVEFRMKAMRSADLREGVQAFREKRRPVWPSHRQ